MRTTEATSLYMFALMPPQELALKVQDIRLAFAQKYGFTKALKPPVHITLFPPFKMAVFESGEFEKDILSLQVWANKYNPFPIGLNNFGFFENKTHPVLFIEIEKNPALSKLHSGLVNELQNYMDVEKQSSPYKPHITLGYRDTTPEAFPAIKKDYSRQSFRESFTCDSFYLWKHDGKNWKILNEFKLKQEVPQPSLF